MCNLYRLDAPADQIALNFAAEAGADPWAGGYVAPGKPGPVIVRNNKGLRCIVPRIWGVPPPAKAAAADGNRPARPVTNVRNLDSPFWIGTLRHPELRCLVPVTSFQEWSDRADPVTGRKTQHWFSIPTEPIFAFAGILRDSEVPSFAFLTTEPNSLVGAVHLKAMPAILAPEDQELWLTADWAVARNLVGAYPSQFMEMA
ncbi:MAG: SOS response-associated peptidase family protein [Parasphingorhabdus sp.]|nr:SOS response-associated peptidase family protein [Parasphingorhabdus sp.]